MADGRTEDGRRLMERSRVVGRRTRVVVIAIIVIRADLTCHVTRAGTRTAISAGRAPAR